MRCDQGQDLLHTSLRCQYQNISERFVQINTFSTAALCAAFLAPACSLCGAAARRLKLPQITGYLLAGVAAGPYVLQLLDESAVQRLWFVDQACLSLIALAAGAELQWEQLEKVKRQVTSITLSITLATWLAVCAVVVALLPYIHATAGMTTSQLLVFCSLAGTLMVARSPASAIAVLQETGGKGTFCSLVLAVVIVKDVLTIVAFSLNIEIARALFAHGRSAHLTLATLIDPFASLVIAVALGVTGAWVVAKSEALALRLAQHPAAPYIKVAGILLLSTLVFEAAAYFEAEPLLACAVTGLLATNTLRDGAREDFHHVLSSAMPGVNLAFFSLAGASLKLDALGRTAWMASLVCAVRTVAVYTGSHLGCWASGSPPEHRSRMWQTMLTQAGVALGLARMVGVRFPSWGPQFQTLAVSTIILNLCIGPPLFRSAIIGTGESRAANARKGDVESPPVGVRERLEPRHEGRHEGMHSRDVSKQGSANL